MIRMVWNELHKIDESVSTVGQVYVFPSLHLAETAY